VTVFRTSDHARHARALEDGLVDAARCDAIADRVPRRAAPQFLSAREIASVERLPVDRTTVSTPSMRRWAPVNALATTTVEPSTATSSVCGVSVTPLRNRRGRCFRGVDPTLEGSPKLVAINKEAYHQIVHRRRFGKTQRPPDEPFDPRPQIDVFTLDALRIFLPHVMLRWVDMPGVCSLSVRIKSRDTKRLQQLLEFEKNRILASPEDVGQHGATVVINRMPQPPRLGFLLTQRHISSNSDVNARPWASSSARQSVTSTCSGCKDCNTTLFTCWSSGSFF
jgi:hypothetical protein